MSSETKRGLALVTGGGTGIGRACCIALAQAGFPVAVHYNRSKDGAEAVVAEIKGLPGAEGSFALGADVSTLEGADLIYDEMKSRGDLDVLVNNAGMTTDAPLFSAKPEDFDVMVRTNMRSAWYLIKRLSRLMMRRKQGRIVNISSIVGSTGNPTQSVYGMTKAAINNLTKTAALELAQYNILVNSVAPGFIDTKMTGALADEHREALVSRIPLGRIGRPEEVAQMVRFLATEGSYCTGSVFHVNGGMYFG